jgi:hypothetical protein
MIKFKEIRERCWTGYKSVPGKAPYSPGSCRKEEMGGGAVPGPTNVVGGGAIAGTGGKGGEPGVDLRKRRKNNLILMGMGRRK